jgi:hypothetical protein
MGNVGEGKEAEIRHNGLFQTAEWGGHCLHTLSLLTIFLTCMSKNGHFESLVFFPLLSTEIVCSKLLTRLSLSYIFSLRLLFYSEDGGSTFFRNTDKHHQTARRHIPEDSILIAVRTSDLT